MRAYLTKNLKVVSISSFNYCLFRTPFFEHPFALLDTEVFPLIQLGLRAAGSLVVFQFNLQHFIGYSVESLFGLSPGVILEVWLPSDPHRPSDDKYTINSVQVSSHFTRNLLTVISKFRDDNHRPRQQRKMAVFSDHKYTGVDALTLEW